jgi:hypothetical protein
LIVQTVPEQAASDWIAVKRIIERKAGDIEVRIADNGKRSAATARWQKRRPSLVFSPVRLFDTLPWGGKLYCGHVVGKDVQLRRLSAIGIPTPRTVILSSLRSFDPEEWGEYVIVKPNNGNSGVGVTLVRTIDVAARCDELNAANPDQLIVEPYIDHSEGGYPLSFRVLSLFGRALYCIKSRWGGQRPPLAEIAGDPRGIIASNSSAIAGRTFSLCDAAEIISLGEDAHKAFPECPVLGVDIIRDSRSGQPYVLEVNPHGAVWHLSSTLSRKLDPAVVRDLYAQFGALDLTADILIERTRSEAR